MNPRTPKQTSQARRWATISALALLCVVSLGGCASSNPQIETSKQQGDNSTAADQTTTQSGFLNFAKSTQAVGLAGGSLLTVIVLLMTLNYRVLMKMIPLVNADDHSGREDDRVDHNKSVTTEDGTKWVPLKVEK
jgi:hypothetical protein